jgi:hypothetical protein
MSGLPACGTPGFRGTWYKRYLGHLTMINAGTLALTNEGREALRARTGDVRRDDKHLGSPDAARNKTPSAGSSSGSS